MKIAKIHDGNKKESVNPTLQQKAVSIIDRVIAGCATDECDQI